MHQSYFVEPIGDEKQLLPWSVRHFQRTRTVFDAVHKALIDMGGGGPLGNQVPWGKIVGNLNNQHDLVDALAAKQGASAGLSALALATLGYAHSLGGGAWAFLDKIPAGDISGLPVFSVEDVQSGEQILVPRYRQMLLDHRCEIEAGGLLDIEGTVVIL